MTKIMEKLFLTLLTRRMHTAIIEIKNEILQKYHCGVFYYKKLFNLKGFKNYFMNLNLKLFLSFPVIFLMSPHHITQKQFPVRRERKKKPWYLFPHSFPHNLSLLTARKRISEMRQEMRIIKFCYLHYGEEEAWRQIKTCRISRF